ncbi:MAG: hypothetical protein DMG68_01070 [Acidobacteria bacterium]|nr:MAG: hypothetical protein DMG68_01070 [Acidobacteriota bacterium]
MVVSCEEVWREISNYLEGELDPNLRAAMAEHLRECKHCTAVLDGTRNVVQLYGDERMFEVPAGFSGRLHRKLESAMPRPRGGAFGWMVAFAAAAVLLISFEVGSSSAFTRLQLRSEHAQPAATPIPPDMMVVVSDEGRTFHVAGCKFIHDKQVRTLTARDAMREGYVPCVRCMRKYVDVGSLQQKIPEEREGGE